VHERTRRPDRRQEGHRALPLTTNWNGTVRLLETSATHRRTSKGGGADAKGVVLDARDVVGRVKRGEGTLGALIMDEAIYDDLQELSAT